jgi:hypothetical protein
MWLDYFHNGEIWGLDNFESVNRDTNPEKAKDIVKCGVNAILFKGGNIIIADQSDEVCLTDVVQTQAANSDDKQGLFDVVIDDGSHYGKHIMTTLKVFWPYVKPGGYYYIEDLRSGAGFPLNFLWYVDNSEVWESFIIKPVSMRQTLRILMPYYFEQAPSSNVDYIADVLKDVIPTLDIEKSYNSMGGGWADWLCCLRKKE